MAGLGAKLYEFDGDWDQDAKILESFLGFRYINLVLSVVAVKNDSSSSIVPFSRKSVRVSDLARE